jgi:hypothetical protein
MKDFCFFLGTTAALGVQDIRSPVVSDMHGGHAGDGVEDADLRQMALPAWRFPHLA